jgi:hypothetical protein
MNITFNYKMSLKYLPIEVLYNSKNKNNEIGIEFYNPLLKNEFEY